MKNLQPCCSNPAIILNPHLKDLILTYRNYHCDTKHVTLNDHLHSRWYLEFPFSRFSKLKKTLSVDDLPLYYIVDANGERQPLFMAVPCGKCIVCTERKANEWVTRSMCESQHSASVPIFFTLTYNNYCLPWNGVRKGSMQRFMKRLRINIDRYCGFKTNIRYFICAEYGSKTKRPHYHGILWNLPLFEPKHLDSLIDKSWSFATNQKFYDSVPSVIDRYGHPVYKYYDEDNKQYRIKYGYTTTSICTDGRVRYAMKYMRKDCQIPDGMKPVFFLSSRRGGLGYQWIESKINEYRKNPQLLDVEFTDIWSGDKYRGVLPTFFKNKIAPSPSLLIKKSIRDKFKLWNFYNNKFHTLIGFDYTPNKRVLAHYPSLHYHPCRVYDGQSKRLLKEIHHDEIQQCHRLNSIDYLNSVTKDLHKIIDFLEYELLNYDYDVGLSVSTPIYKKQHLTFVEKYIDSCPDVKVSDKAWSINRKRRISQYREVL